jgi:hypothetical protein
VLCYWHCAYSKTKVETGGKGKGKARHEVEVDFFGFYAHFYWEF